MDPQSSQDDISLPTDAQAEAAYNAAMAGGGAPAGAPGGASASPLALDKGGKPTYDPNEVLWHRHLDAKGSVVDPTKQVATTAKTMLNDGRYIVQTYDPKAGKWVETEHGTDEYRQKAYADLTKSASPEQAAVMKAHAAYWGQAERRAGAAADKTVGDLNYAKAHGGLTPQEDQARIHNEWQRAQATAEAMVRADHDKLEQAKAFLTQEYQTFTAGMAAADLAIKRDQLGVQQRDTDVTAGVTQRGQDINAGVSQRGQDLSAQTAARGQDLGLAGQVAGHTGALLTARLPYDLGPTNMQNRIDLMNWLAHPGQGRAPEFRVPGPGEGPGYNPLTVIGDTARATLAPGALPAMTLPGRQALPATVSMPRVVSTAQPPTYNPGAVIAPPAPGSIGPGAVSSQAALAAAAAMVGGGGAGFNPYMLPGAAT